MSQAKNFTLSFVILFALLIILWSFYSFEAGPISDGWTLLLSVDEGQVWRQDFTRLFANIPTVLAHWLDPTLFSGAVTVLFVLACIRAACIFVFVNGLTDSAPFSFGCAALYCVLPNESAIFWQGSMGMNMGTTLFILALTCFVHQCYSTEKKIHSHLFSNTSLLLLAVSLLSYPGSIFTAMLLPIFFASSRELQIKFLLRWYLIIILAVAVYGFAIATEAGRNVRVFDLNITEFLNSFYFQIKRFFSSIVTPIKFKPTDILLFLVVSIGSYISFILLSTRTNNSGKTTSSLIKIGFIGLLIYVSALIPFALSEIRYSDRRVMLLANLGIVLLLAAFGKGIINKFSNWTQTNKLSYAVPALIIAVAFIQSKENAIWYRQASNKQLTILSAISNEIPTLNSNQLLMLNVTDSNLLSDIKGLVNRPTPPIRYFYQSTAHAVSLQSMPYFKLRPDRLHVDLVRKDKLVARFGWDDVIILNINKYNHVERIQCTTGVPYFRKRSIDKCTQQSLDYHVFSNRRCELEKRYIQNKQKSCIGNKAEPAFGG